jgi:chaperone modulatory protein CbpM
MSETLLQILDAETSVALEELLRASGLAREDVVELVEYGIFQPQGAPSAWRFASHTIVVARRAARLRSDFGLDTSGLVLALTYLERIEALERRIRELECGLPR